MVDLAQEIVEAVVDNKNQLFKIIDREVEIIMPSGAGFLCIRSQKPLAVLLDYINYFPEILFFECAIVVSGSHGGASSGAYALEVPLRAAFFNDAGIGKEDAGIVALGMLQAAGVAAGTVSHESARIGDAKDCWENGVLSRCNAAARALGVEPGASLRAALSQLVAR